MMIYTTVFLPDLLRITEHDTADVKHDVFGHDTVIL